MVAWLVVRKKTYGSRDCTVHLSSKNTYEPFETSKRMDHDDRGRVFSKSGGRFFIFYPVTDKYGVVVPGSTSTGNIKREKKTVPLQLTDSDPDTV